MAKLKKIECEPQCGFAVQSHDEKEVINIASNHARSAHKMKVSEADAKAMMKTV